MPRCSCVKPLGSEHLVLMQVKILLDSQAAERRAQEAEEEELRIEQESQAELRSLRARLSEADSLRTEVRFLLHSKHSITQ